MVQHKMRQIIIKSTPFDTFEFWALQTAFCPLCTHQKDLRLSQISDFPYFLFWLATLNNRLQKAPWDHCLSLLCQASDHTGLDAVKSLH